jgi:hypothetical protein
LILTTLSLFSSAVPYDWPHERRIVTTALSSVVPSAATNKLIKTYEYQLKNAKAIVSGSLSFAPE